jgi:hypothetical protein
MVCVDIKYLLFGGLCFFTFALVYSLKSAFDFISGKF